MNNNVNLKVINTRKYKMINLYLRFSVLYTAKNKAALLLLSKMIGETSRKYDTKEKMTRAKDMLYGMDLYSGLKISGGIVTLALRYSFLNPQFVDDVSMDDYLEFIKETLFNFELDEKLLDETKRNTIDSFKRAMDRPSAYSTDKVKRIIAEDFYDFKPYVGDISEDIETVTIDDMKEAYQGVLNRYRLDMYLIGNIDDSLIETIRSIDFKDRENCVSVCHAYNAEEKEDIIENKNVSQSYLTVAYSSPYTAGSDDYYAFIVGNIFLGSVPTSLLFEEVREKLSLCYSIGVNDYRKEGLVLIRTDINADSKEKVIEEIERQINRVINMDYEYEKFEMSKTLFLNSIESLNDELSYLVDFYFNNTLLNNELSLEEYAEKIRSVTPEDVSRVFKNYRHYFTYFLRGIKDEENI